MLIFWASSGDQADRKENRIGENSWYWLIYGGDCDLSIPRGRDSFNIKQFMSLIYVVLIVAWFYYAIDDSQDFTVSFLSTLS